MPRYGIPEEEKGPYITDFLREVPKAEAKAFLQEGKSAQDLLDFLYDLYAGGQAARRASAPVPGEKIKARGKI